MALEMQCLGCGIKLFHEVRPHHVADEFCAECNAAYAARNRKDDYPLYLDESLMDMYMDE